MTIQTRSRPSEHHERYVAGNKIMILTKVGRRCCPKHARVCEVGG
jgi:hypothetical protein